LLLRIISIALLCIAGCNSVPTVQQYGGMRETLRMGQTQPRITFEEVIATPHSFAVGALPNLEGEVTIFDGSIWVATADNNSATTVKADSQFLSATLLTVAHVNHWDEYELPDIPLEEAIEAVALGSSTLDSEEPFPFLIQGEASTLHMHVINGYCPVASPDLADEYKPWRMSIDSSTPITVVGFFAKNQEGVMTHHGSNIHIHGLMTKDRGVATGHLDSISMKKGAKLFLPAS